jgi:flagellar motor switch protein FliN/FliY
MASDVAVALAGATPTATGTAIEAASQAQMTGTPALGRLAEVMLDVTVELGRSRIPIRELLALDEGGVIRLGRTVGEPVDLLVNGLATARGEIVVVDGKLGLRVSELIA